MTGRAGNPNAREPQEQTLVLNIDLTRGLVAALLVVAAAVVVALLVRGPSPASAAGEAVSAATDNMRRYYLGGPVADGTLPIGSCEPGYHFASVWEILDTSNLVYNTSLGVPAPDSGWGPPSTWYGWVRTGATSQNNATPGQANCNVWDSTSGYGTIVRVAADWLAGSELHVWDAGIADCAVPNHVWCVED